MAFESRNEIAARARFPAAKPLNVAGTAVEKMYFPAALLWDEGRVVLSNGRLFNT